MDRYSEKNFTKGGSIRTKKWGIALALLLSAAILMPNTAFTQSGDEGQSFVEDLVEHPQSETEEKEVVAEVKSEAETKAEKTEETVQPKQDKKEAVLSKESVGGKSLTILHTNDVHGTCQVFLVRIQHF